MEEGSEFKAIFWNTDVVFFYMDIVTYLSLVSQCSYAGSILRRTTNFAVYQNTFKNMASLKNLCGTEYLIRFITRSNETYLNSRTSGDVQRYFKYSRYLLYNLFRVFKVGFMCTSFNWNDGGMWYIRLVPPWGRTRTCDAYIKQKTGFFPSLFLILQLWKTRVA